MVFHSLRKGEPPLFLEHLLGWFIMSACRIIRAARFCNFDSLFMLWEVHWDHIMRPKNKTLGGYMNYNIA